MGYLLPPFNILDNFCGYYPKHPRVCVSLTVLLLLVHPHFKKDPSPPPKWREFLWFH